MGTGLLAGALVVAGTVGTAGAAEASEGVPSAEIAWAGKAVSTDGGETAQVLVKYRCSGVPFHLWASVKQGPDLDPTVRGGTSSANAVSWRETPEGPVPTCDGTWNVERITVEATPDTAGKLDLSRGDGWLQFVIFVGDPDGFDPDSGEGVTRAAVGDPRQGGTWIRVVGNA